MNANGEAADVNPIENGVQQAYQEIRESIESILRWEFQRDQDRVSGVLQSLDNAISNNWDELMLAFWRGVAQDIDPSNQAIVLIGS